MIREILLARRLLEAVSDPDAPQWSVDEAGAELAEISARVGKPDGSPIDIDSFEGLRPDDLSPPAWLLLLEGRGEGDPEIPVDILEALFLEIQDPIIRFRLVRGALGQPDTYRRYLEAVERPRTRGNRAATRIVAQGAYRAACGVGGDTCRGRRSVPASGARGDGALFAPGRIERRSHLGGSGGRS
jgi:hypothetical protein